MSYRFGKTSRERLETCDVPLIEVMEHVIKIIDCTILQGHRGEDEQNYYFKTGKSKLQWPKSRHNSNPSRAVDAAPWPIDWHDLNRFNFFGGVVMATGYQLGHQLRWGGDWDMDNDFSDQTFMDLVHFEYLGPARNRPLMA